MTPDQVKKLLADSEFRNLSVLQQEEVLRRGGAPMDDEMRAFLQHLKGDTTPGQASVAEATGSMGEHVATHPFQTAALAANFIPGVGLIGGAAFNMAGGMVDQALGFNPAGTAEAARSLPSTIGMALAGRVLPPGFSPIVQGTAYGAGGLAGEGLAQATGMVDPNPGMLAASAGLPAAAGAGLNSLTGIARSGARMIPGNNPAMHEAALQRAQALPLSFAPTTPAKDLYEALAQKSGDVMVPTPELAAARTRYWQEELELAKYSPESLSPEIAAASGSDAIQSLVSKQPQLLKSIDRQRLTVTSTGISATKAAQRLDALVNSPNPSPDKIALARRELELANARASDAEELYTQLQGDYSTSIQDLGELLNGIDTPFPVLQTMLKRQNARYVSGLSKQDSGKGGEYLGAVKDIRKAIKTDLEKVALYPELQQANAAFRKELAIDYLREVANSTLSDMQGVTGVNAQTLASRIKRTIADEDGPLSGLSPAELKQVDEFYSDLSRRFSPANNLMMGMVWTGIGSALAGSMMGMEGAGQFAAGGIGGLMLSNGLARIALASPRWRKAFITMLDAGKGRISQDTLETLVQLSSQESSRSAYREDDVDVSLAPQNQSLFANARREPTAGQNLIGALGGQFGGINPAPGY